MREKWRFPLDVAPAFCIFAVLVPMFGAISLISLPIIASGFIAFYFFKIRAHAAASMKKDMAQAASSLREIVSKMALGGTLAESLSSASSAAKFDGHVKSVLARLSKRLACGQDLGRAISAETWRIRRNGRLLASFSSLGEEYRLGGSIRRAAQSASISLKGYLDEAKENDSGKLQRYLIAATVASTIVPSILTFAFVGYSILYYSGLLLLLYSSIMLGILPCAYGIARIKLVGVYEA